MKLPLSINVQCGGVVNHHIRLNNYVHLSIQSISFLLAVKFLTTVLHELGHCLGGWFAGLNPVGIYAAVFGGGMSYFSGPRVTWQNLEKLKIHLNEGMCFLDYELIPKNAKKPDRYDKHEIVWENRDSTVPEKIRLFFSANWTGN